MAHSYIAFEGPIAAGKTTLATLFGKHLSADIILEEFEGNEFLADFYRDRDRWSLAMQLWFLATRRAQLSRIARPFSRHIVADYSTWKDRIFAEMLLRDRELRLFTSVDELTVGALGPPDLVVYLDANNRVLLDRIRSRGRPYEQSIDGGYLESLRGAYEYSLPSWRGSRVMRYDTSDLDLNSSAQMSSLYREIQTAAEFPSIS
jgi:deoxyguanosine kinase